MTSMKVLYSNVRSIYNKIGELKVMASLYSPQIICITETWINSDILDAEIQIPNFTIYREDRKNDTRYGGSAIYVHNCLDVQRLDWFNGLESLALHIKSDTHEFTVITLYRATSRKTFAANQDMLDAISRLPTSDDNNILLVGGVNMPHVKWDTGTIQLPNETTDQGLLTEKKFLDLFCMKGFNWYNRDHQYGGRHSSKISFGPGIL